jgi:hypothetical protein
MLQADTQINILIDQLSELHTDFCSFWTTFI